MGDGRDGLAEAVHLAAEKRRISDEVVMLREALAQALAEVERLRAYEAEWKKAVDDNERLNGVIDRLVAELETA